MNRRDFLKVAGAVASIEIEHVGAAEGGAGRATIGGDGDVASFARSLPGADGLAGGTGYALSVTRLGDDETTVVDGPVADAAAYGTVFAGRVATDVAFGIEDRGAVLDRFAADGYERTERHDGWIVLAKRLRTRHEVVAVTDSTAVIGSGPVRAAVLNDVREAMAAVDRASDGRDVGGSDRRRILDHLGPGTHLSVDVTPGPKRTAESVVATGERFDVRGDTTVVRDVTLFDAHRRARASDPAALDSGRHLIRRAEGVAVGYRGRAVVRDATVPTTTFLSRT